MRYPTALTIAGSDSGGGAGIQADLKTFSALGVYGASVITAITAQNTREVRAVESLSAKTVRQQLETVLDDIPVDAIKTGMLISPEIIETVAWAMDHYQLKTLVVDPVMKATSGKNLTQTDIANALRTCLYPCLTLLTPNIPEAELLTGISIRQEADVYTAGELLLHQGCNAVLIKGGHQIENQLSTDILFTSTDKPQTFSSAFLTSPNLHGTGCTLASAITAYLALGFTLSIAVKKAKQYISQAIEAGTMADFNGANGPVNHFFHPKPLKPII